MIPPSPDEAVYPSALSTAAGAASDAAHAAMATMTKTTTQRIRRALRTLRRRPLACQSFQRAVSVSAAVS